MTDRKETETASGIGRHLSMLAAWGLSFGYAVGWGAFVMPEMTGEELVAAIRADTGLKTLKVYLFTAEVEMKDTYAEKGFSGILLKPANLEALKNLLQ